MKTNIRTLLLLVVAVIASYSCSKELSVPQEGRGQLGEMKDGVDPLPQTWPRIRFTHNYEFINGCSDGECGSCIGLCVFWPIRMGPAPTPTELEEGIGRADMFAQSTSVVVIPKDLPMDPGSGEVILDDDLAIGGAVADYLGFSRVVLSDGTYTVDYSKGDRYGRIEVPAQLIP